MIYYGLHIIYTFFRSGIFWKITQHKTNIQYWKELKKIKSLQHNLRFSNLIFMKQAYQKRPRQFKFYST
ncbi:hypothetical protein GQ41_1324 [Arenibacter algicola]|uniref:Uncharacterized protein n=1 Tax=Arenibacter algicola TaxID=616991 RepID=A0ABY3A8H3_9FLAO|nr:hypothetical protein C21_01325 [Arenibacter sp. NBRC 103722]